MGRGGQRTTRRGVLLAGGTALVGLAGCAEIRSHLDDTGSSLAFDPAELEDLEDQATLTAPEPFPVEIPPAWVERHRERARALLDAVPESPDIPNEVMADKLRSNRKAAAEAIRDDVAAGGHHEGHRTEPRNARERLQAWRYRRRRAAAVRAAYRAAIGDLDRRAVRDRRGTLRSDVTAFTTSVDYRGPNPIATLVLHHEIEELVEEMRGGVEGWPTFPGDPADAVFRVGDFVATIERGRAALEDALALRERFLDSAGQTESFRDAFGVAAHRLGRDLTETTHRMDRYVDSQTPPFDRDVADTPAAELYRRLRARTDGVDRSFDRSLHRGHVASAVFRAGTGLTELETLESAAAAIEEGNYAVPETATVVRREREHAVANLRHAWNHDPRVLSRTLATPALHSLRMARDAFERGSLGRREVFHLYAQYAHARRYAALVPDATDHVLGALRKAPAP